MFICATAAHPLDLLSILLGYIGGVISSPDSASRMVKALPLLPWSLFPPFPYVMRVFWPHLFEVSECWSDSWQDILSPVFPQTHPFSFLRASTPVPCSFYDFSPVQMVHPSFLGKGVTPSARRSIKVKSPSSLPFFT